MLYGLYVSAAGVISSSYRQDVLANNLANSETTGFKRDLALFTQRRTEAQTRGVGQSGTNQSLENLGGGIFVAPSQFDGAQGDVETTGNPNDLAIMGSGYFAVRSQGKDFLTRAGNFTSDAQGNLVVANGRGDQILDEKLKPVTLDPTLKFDVDKFGTVTQAGKPVAKLAVLDANSTDLKKHGSDLFEAPDLATLSPASTVIESGSLERSNVDPSVELTQLIDSQRQLEANANMIRYQDETLGRLVNDVAKVG
jgi:flagellar basal-body rod protein FlgF